MIRDILISILGGLIGGLIFSLFINSRDRFLIGFLLIIALCLSAWLLV